MGARLEYRDDKGNAKVLDLSESRDAIIGRNPDCDLVLQHDVVSRRHARLSFHAGAWTIIDLSAHGTLLNRLKIPSDKPTALAAGDRVQIGDFFLDFVVADAAHPASKDGIVLEHDVAAGDLMRTFIGATRIDVTKLGTHPAGDVSVARLVKREAKVPGSATTDPPASPDAAIRLDAEVAGQLLTLVRIGDALRRAPDLKSVCRAAIETAMSATGANRGQVALGTVAEGFVPVVSLAAAPDKTIAPSDGIRPSRTFVDRVVKERIALAASEDNFDEKLASAASVVASGIRSILCAPLWDGTEIHGFLYLDATDANVRFPRELVDLVSVIAHHAAAEIRARDEQERLRNLGRFLAEDVIRHIDAEAKAGRLDPSLSAREQEVTILFSDIKGFTSMSERMGAPAIKKFLDEYFDRMTKILVDDHHATLDKFLGDGIMALFGAPFSRGDKVEAFHAVAAAVEMRDEVARMRATRPEFSTLEIRIGINTGKVVAGMLGSPTRRMDYAVIGDVVNVASRLESTGEPGRIQIGEITHSHISDDFLTESAGERHVKNRAQAVRSFWVNSRKPA